MRSPTGSQPTKAQAQETVNAVKGAVSTAKGSVRRFGRVINKGVNWLTQPSKDYNKAQKEKDDINRQEGEDMMAGRERLKGSM